MKQSRGMSLLESAINIGVGFGISLTAQIVFLPLLGVAIDLQQNFAFALIMTAVSLGRQFILRRLFEALHIRQPLSPAMHAVIAERRRQIEVEGWSLEQDDTHQQGELAAAGATYARHAYAGGYPSYGYGPGQPPKGWPWSHQWWKPADFRRNLVKAAALILAEIEKFDRNKSTHATKQARYPLQAKGG